MTRFEKIMHKGRTRPLISTNFNQVNESGHFTAWERPAIFTAELRAAFESLR